MLVPSQFSATSQIPSAARHSVVAEATASAGHAADVPVHCLGYITDSFRCSAFCTDLTNSSATHSLLVPSQFSATSQIPSAARHSVVAEATASAGHAADVRYTVRLHHRFLPLLGIPYRLQRIRLQHIPCWFRHSSRLRHRFHQLLDIQSWLKLRHLPDMLPMSGTLFGYITDSFRCSAFCTDLTNSSATHSLLVPSQFSATSQIPSAARHSVVAEATASAGHAADVRYTVRLHHRFLPLLGIPYRLQRIHLQHIPCWFRHSSRLRHRFHQLLDIQSWLKLRHLPDMLPMSRYTVRLHHRFLPLLGIPYRLQRIHLQHIPCWFRHSSRLRHRFHQLLDIQSWLKLRHLPDMLPMSRYTVRLHHRFLPLLGIPYRLQRIHLQHIPCWFRHSSRLRHRFHQLLDIQSWLKLRHLPDMLPMCRYTVRLHHRFLPLLGIPYRLQRIHLQHIPCWFRHSSRLRHRFHQLLDIQSWLKLRHLPDMLPMFRYTVRLHHRFLPLLGILYRLNEFICNTFLAGSVTVLGYVTDSISCSTFSRG